ncbi:PREDICTED: fluoride export protein 2 isoform X2 [Nelumbo nucifera]|uniref:Uncharacterized protein n=2 Tax=Nelumbo nucifera TaxID=4432 RepID=A0A822Z4S9_NELNU|nr:PREDICTED: fluoride export protein 2 isoform X2 [Nelumbo nucifera]DAD39563.1 TPA_asm: hypothetical protein HUJ06_013886 [Nelumbo nucifera]
MKRSDSHNENVCQRNMFDRKSFRSLSLDRRDYNGMNGNGPRQGGGSCGQISGIGSLQRRHSLSLSRGFVQVSDDLESETMSQAGDIGDRALHSNRYSENSSFRFSLDDNSLRLENGVGSIPEDDVMLQSYGFCVRDGISPDAKSPVSPLPSEIISPLSTDAIIHSGDKNQSQASGYKNDQKQLPLLLEYISCLAHLAFFGILGVGSFLMGWLGVVFKGDICNVSDLLAIGLTTGYLGSLTTFSGWNQKMLDLSVKGHWVFCVVGFLLGMLLAAQSIILGVDTARDFRKLLKKLRRGSSSDITNSEKTWRVDSCKRHLAVLMVLVLMVGLLWGVSGALVRKRFDDDNKGAELWLACLVAPPGVWARWFLARLNGRGLGKKGLLKWVPFGTLIANVSAAFIMAALATVKKAVDSKTCETVATGLQFGFMGCLSTVSTFIAEYNAMRESKHPWRANAYALMTILPSFGLGILIYAIPVWANGYE